MNLWIKTWKSAAMAAVLAAVFAGATHAQGEILVASNSVWKYLDDGSDQGTAWRAPGFNDAAWPSGPAELGFGDGGEVTLLARTNAAGTTNVTYYFRRAFAVTNPATITNLVLSLLRDDGALVWLNGTLVLRDNMPEDPVNYLTFALLAVSGTDETTYWTYALNPALLVEGANLLAVEVHQVALTSSDVSFDLQLNALRATANAPPTAAITTPTNNTRFAAPASIYVNATASDADGTITQVDLYENGAFVRTEFSAPYEWTLNPRYAGPYAYRAVAQDNLGARGTSAVVSVTVTGNVPPTVSLTLPTNNSVFSAPANILLSATAADADGSVTNVEFRRGTTLIASDATSPYGLTWSNVAVGTYALRAIAVDNAGARSTSAVANVTVQANTAPTISITKPGDGATFTAPASIDLVVNAADADGTVTNVDYYANGGRIGGTATAPFDFPWSAVVTGAYALTAVASDNAGARATSAVVNVTVTAGSFTNTLVPFGAVWKYNDTGTDLGTAWVAPAYNDATWPSGPAELGYGDGDEVTVVGYGPDPGNRYITTYFRRAFLLSNPGAYTNLTLSLLRDDGGVVYLNGTEIFRSPTLPAGPISFSTLSALGPDNFVDVADVSAFLGLLVNGTNVLAVEIHQQSPSSSDISFNLEMVGITGTAPSNAPPTVALLSPTNNATFPQPANVVLTASASDPDGSVMRVQFFQGTTLLAEATTAPYTFTWPGVGPGSYTLRAVAVDNRGATATSAPVNVTVTTNLNQPPTVTITSPTNNSTFDAPTNLTVTVQAQDPDGGVTRVEYFRTGVKVGESVTPPFSFVWSNALLGVWQLTAVATDTGGAAATSAPVSVTFTGAAPSVLIAAGAVWRYRDTGEDLGTAWVLPAYDDAAWAAGPAELGYGDGDEATLVGYGPDPNNKYVTTYFRHTFPAAGPAAFSYLSMLVKRDDGVVVYLNGTEIWRSLMPEGAVTYLTRGVNAEEPGLWWSNNVPASLLVPGANVLAAEVHQASASSSDLSFALELVGQTGAIVNNPPGVALTSPRDGSVFTAPAFITLNASATDSDGSVSRVEFFVNDTLLGEDPTPPYGYTWGGVAIGQYAFQAVATDNFGARATSAVVNVSVTPSSAPTLLGQSPTAGSLLSNLVALTVTFSEPVDGVNASDLLLNGLPATGLTGSNAVWTFTFPPPAEGLVTVSFALNHGIVDREAPPRPLDATAAEATWTYTLVDTVPPTAVSISPAPGATLTALPEVRVSFSEPVGSVNAGDLLINGSPATSVRGSGAGPYAFGVRQPVSNGLCQVAWTPGHGIRDFAAAINPFAGGAWNYTLHTNLNESVVVINEILYHPSSEQTTEEYIELYNNSGAALNLTGWRLRGAVEFTFPGYTLPPGGYVVVAADLAAFQAKYPGVTNVVGPWAGRLSNSDEDIDLDNALGQRVDSVHYADQGDWAVRRRLPDETAGLPSWEWYAEHDGLGKSLELCNPWLPNQHGQNWLPSLPAQGTPGRVNSVRTDDLPPMILDVTHLPPVPRSSESVSVTARLVDEVASGHTVTLWWRLGTNPFTATVMADDGWHGDSLPNDGVWGASIPPQTNRAVVEFYVQAFDPNSNARTWPGPTDTNGTQGANALYQVDDSSYAGDQPYYRLIMTEAEDTRLYQLNASNPYSNARMNGTFISVDGTETQVRYLAGIRLRGAGSRGTRPPNLRVNLPGDRRWKGVTSLNLNILYTHSQLAASILARKAGLVAEEAIAVQVRRNGSNYCAAGLPQFGSVIHLEPRDTDFCRNHFPLDPNGNLYTCTRPGSDLSYRGTNAAAYSSVGYQKQSNTSENDYSDLARLTDVLNNTPDGDYPAAVRQVLNVEQWLRCFAVTSLLGYNETSLTSDGAPDDYTLYRGVNDPRFLIWPHDHDTDLGEGAPAAGFTLDPFRACANPVVNRFLKWPDFAPLYFAELKHQCDTTFASPGVNDVLWNHLGSWVNTDTVRAMTNWVAQRRAYVLSLIPLNLSLTPPALVQQAGYYSTTTPSVSLSGRANAIQTRSVKLNGQFANWTAWQAAWSGSLTLQPGVNRVVIQSLDQNYQVFEEQTVDIWYDDGSTVSLSGTLAGDTTWTAAGGPYVVTNNLTVPAGVTLTIQPGASVFFSAGVTLTVNGRLVAEGTEAQRIRFTRPPGASGQWVGIRFVNAQGEQRLTCADIEYAGAGAAPNVGATGSTLRLERVVWANTTSQLLDLNNSSITLLNSVLPSILNNELMHFSTMPANGHALIQGNRFGTPGIPATTGYNDIIDFTGGNRPGPIAEFLDNVFTSAVDDVLDLDGTDAHIEGNLFMNVHQDALRDSAAHAISTGQSSGHTSELFIARNIFYDCDHALLLKEGASAVLQNNTIVRVYTNATSIALAAALNFGEPNGGVAGGAGVVQDGNIFWELDANRLYLNFTNGLMYSEVNHCLTPGTNWPGTGNLNLDPLFVSTDPAGMTWQNLRQNLSLRPGSPARGTGPNGLDMGAVVPAGASLSGEPTSPTPLTRATLTVGGPGIVNYRWRVNSGAWSAETSVTTPIVLTGLSNGLYRVSVIGQNSAGTWQAYSNATVSRAWTVRNTLVPVRLNEVLALNDRAVAAGGRYPDLVELYNYSSDTVDLTGMGITDNDELPYKFYFPPGTLLGGGQYLVLYADSEVTPPGLHLGFSLKGEGDDLSLFNVNGQLVDRVEFGLQVRDYSLGRGADGVWTLGQPTFGAANVPQRTGDPRTLKINEWLTDGQSPYAYDFIELFNPDPLPVALDGLYWSDTPSGAPFLHALRPRSFIAGGGFAVFIADGDPGAGADHVDFKLDPLQGLIALVGADGWPIDCVIYGPQRTDVSMGRQPNGAATYGYFQPPTPGAPNPGFALPGQTLVINEVLAWNTTTTNLAGNEADRVELFNPSANPIALTDMSLTDNPATPRRYVFPAGLTVPPLGRYVLDCDPDAPVSAVNTAFGLKAGGSALYLFDTPARGGSQLDAVSFGPQAADFSIGRVPDGSTNWALGQPTFGAANIAAALGDPMQLRVNEWMANPKPGDDDWFELYNPGGQPVALGGLWLSDNLSSAAQRQKHRIAALSFLGLGAYAYTVFVADGNVGAGPDHVNFRLAGDGEFIGLSTPAGAPIDDVQFFAQQEGVSEGMLPEGTTNKTRFPVSASPGDANYLPLGNVVINEVLSHTDAPLEDAIELYNSSATPVAIGGWWLSDAKHALQKYRIPTNTVIPARGYVVFYEYQFNPDPNDPASFSLNSAKGDEVYLAQAGPDGALTGYRAEANFGAAEGGVSFGRYTNSAGTVHFVALTRRTFGADNPETAEQFRAGAGLPNASPKVGPVVFSEIMYHPPDTPTGDNVADEYLELLNITGTTQALHHPVHATNTWRLRDGVKFSFPPGVRLPPGGRLRVVSFDPAYDPAALARFRARYGLPASLPVYGPYEGKLDNGGETLELLKPDAPQLPPDPDAGYVPYILVERIKYSDTAPWPAAADGTGAALARVSAEDYGNDPANWQAVSTAPADSDGDGMPDSWEVAYGFNPNDPDDAALDADGDGLSNLQEYQAGTHPRSADSVLRLDITPAGQAMLQFQGVAGKAYTILQRDTLGMGPWQVFTNFVAGDTGLFQFPISTSQASRFYRLSTP